MRTGRGLLPRCPHACGDGPNREGATGSQWLLSPREWGWSAPSGSTSPCAPVVPTRVGMVRCMPAFPPTSTHCPHASGDGPFGDKDGNVMSALSPREWGWSVQCCPGCYPCHVGPTHVGMVRVLPISDPGQKCCPHACGDGPSDPAQADYEIKLSPRVWGWSGGHGEPDDFRPVVPTRVGMVRRSATPSRDPTRCPHACGEGPATIKDRKHRCYAVSSPERMAGGAVAAEETCSWSASVGYCACCLQ